MRHRRKARTIGMLAWLTLVLSAAVGSAAEVALTILHTSEHHGQALAIEERNKPRSAGMPGRAALIAQIRRETPNVLLVDSGDILIGTALSSFFRGEPDIKAMNLMGYQAMATGNHDFDFGFDHLRRLQGLAQFPMLCSNVVGRGIELPCRVSATLQVGPVKIGVIGLLGRTNFPDTFNRQVVALLDLLPPLRRANDLARMLKTEEHVDLVVAVTHEAQDEDLALLKENTDIDVIVGGHTEGFDGLRTRGADEPAETRTDPGPVFVRAHRLGRALGRLDLRIDKSDDARQPSRVISATARNIPITEASGAEPAVSALLADYAQKLESQTNTVVGRSLVTLDGDSAHVRARETNLGDLLADLLRTEFGTEVALLNSGQIRDSIPPGPIELKRVLRVLPFNSPTVTLSLTGEQLRAALENSASRLPDTNGRFLQVSGLTVLYDPAASVGERVREVKIGDRALDPRRRYTVATDAFLADGGDGYGMLRQAADRVERQIPMRDLLLTALQDKPLKASTDGRIRFTEAVTAPPAPGMAH